jgi:hypothetical protein
MCKYFLERITTSKSILRKHDKCYELSGSHVGEYEDDSHFYLPLCSLVEVDRRFRSVYYLNCQGDDDGRQYAPLKRQYTSTRLNGAISQKASIS